MSSKKTCANLTRVLASQHLHEHHLLLLLLLLLLHEQRQHGRTADLPPHLLRESTHSRHMGDVALVRSGGVLRGGLRR